MVIYEWPSDFLDIPFFGIKQEANLVLFWLKQDKTKQEELRFPSHGRHILACSSTVQSQH